MLFAAKVDPGQHSLVRMTTWCIPGFPLLFDSDGTVLVTGFDALTMFGRAVGQHCDLHMTAEYNSPFREWGAIFLIDSV